MKEYLDYLKQLNIEQLLQEKDALLVKLEFTELLIQAASAAPEMQGGELEGGVIGSARLTENDLTYGLMRFGKGQLAGSLRRGQPLEVWYKNKKYTATVPSATNYPAQSGRVNGMTRLYRENAEITSGVTVHCTLDPVRHVLHITQVKR